MDIEGDLVPRDLLVWENANQMSRDGAAVLPASLPRQLLGIRVQLRRGDLRVFMKIPLAASKRFFDVAAQLAFLRIASNDVGPTEIGFPFFEHGAEIEKDDVVLPDRQVWRVLIVRCQSVAPCSHDAFVPIARDPIHTFGKRVDALIDFAFLSPWANQALRLDLCE